MILFRGKQTIKDETFFFHLPTALGVDAGADSQSSKLPAGKLLWWFGHKDEGSVVGIISGQWVQILPLSRPLVGVSFSYRREFNTVLLFIYSLLYYKYGRRLVSTDRSLCTPTVLCWASLLWPMMCSTACEDFLRHLACRSTAIWWSWAERPSIEGLIYQYALKQWKHEGKKKKSLFCWHHRWR